MADKPKIEVRQFKSRGAYERDVRDMLGKGWTVQSSSTTTSRRMLGCLLGLIGYWLLPKRTVYHVTYVYQPAPIEPSAPRGF